MPAPTLTAADPPGYYECRFFRNAPDWRVVRWWTGKVLHSVRHNGEDDGLDVREYTDFIPLREALTTLGRAIDAEWLTKYRERAADALESADPRKGYPVIVWPNDLAILLAALPHGPFAVMAGAPWNVLDSRGCRIACCGGDSNADHERHGPAIAAAIVEALNAHPAPSPPGEPMTKEREAAERLEQWLFDNQPWAHGATICEFVPAIVRKAVEILRDNPPDDSEPLDKEFVERCDALSDSSNFTDLRRYEICGDSVRLLAHACEGPKCWQWSIWVGKKLHIDNPTRGQLRRLCAALGITLKGPQA